MGKAEQGNATTPSLTFTHVMPPGHMDTGLGLIDGQASIRIRCVREREIAWPFTLIANAFSPADTLYAMRARFRCKRCRKWGEGTVTPVVLARR
jgi:hypothetical protein